MDSSNLLQYVSSAPLSLIDGLGLGGYCGAGTYRCIPLNQLPPPVFDQYSWEYYDPPPIYTGPSMRGTTAEEAEWNQFLYDVNVGNIVLPPNPSFARDLNRIFGPDGAIVNGLLLGGGYGSSFGGGFGRNPRNSFNRPSYPRTPRFPQADKCPSKVWPPKPAHPSIPHPGYNSTPGVPDFTPPGSWQWGGLPPQGGRRGNWFNKQTGESLSNDMGSTVHPPHWEYRIKGQKGKWRWYTDGGMEWTEF